MAGPWEKFQTPTEKTSAPWEQYAGLNEAGREQFGTPPRLNLNMSDVTTASPRLPKQGGAAPIDPLTAQAASTGSGEAYLVGAGRSFDKMATGAQDLALLPFAFSGNEKARAKRALIARDQAAKDRLYQPLSQAKPKSTFLGEMTPYALGPRRLPMLSQRASNVAVPGLMGFSEYGSAGERLQKGALGGVVGAGGNLFARGVGGRTIPEGTDPYIAQTIQRGEELGFRVVPSVTRRSRSLQTKEASMVSDPLTSDIASEAGEHNERRLVEIAAESIGLEDVDRLSPDQLRRARANIVSRFDEAGAGTRVSLDDDFLTEINRVAEEYSEGVGRRSNKIRNIVQDLRALGDDISPAEYRRQISTLATDARSAAAKDGAKSNAMYEIREALDQAFDRSTSRPPPVDEYSARFSDELRETLNAFGDREGQLARFREARNQYRSLMNLEGAVTEAGDVSYLKLANTIRRNDKSGYLYGNRESELYDALRFLKIFPKQFGRPGTAEALSGRGAREGILGRARDPALAGAGIGGYLGGPDMAMLGGALGAGAGLLGLPSKQAAARLYYSQALNRGLIPMRESTQDLLSAGVTKLLTPGLLSLPERE